MAVSSSSTLSVHFQVLQILNVWTIYNTVWISIMKNTFELHVIESIEKQEIIVFRNPTILLYPLNDVHTRISPYGTTHFANLQSKSCFFKWFLHLTPPKHAQVASPLGRAAVTVLGGQLFKSFLSRINLIFEFWKKARTFKPKISSHETHSTSMI